LWQWQQLMLSLRSGEPDGHQETQIKIRKAYRPDIATDMVSQTKPHPAENRNAEGDLSQIGPCLI
jgi:hypothetical protein